MQVRCPQCHTPIELSGDSSLSDIACPSCGSSFSLIGEDETAPYEATKTIGHFELVEQIGTGTFGSVWRARDTDLDRVVAIKIPRKGQLDPTEAEQFLREARAAAQLRHPSIVTVHEVGREADTVFIVSDYVEGLTLADWLTGQTLTSREAAELCAKIADALHHAHQAGVIHRDLKPGNVILDADGEPHIMDFGLARREAGEVTMTVEGKVLGTPAYMSPEQAKGAAHTADRRSDVYSLGVILFELLTGERPFRGNVRMLMHQVIHEDAPNPRKLNSNVPRDLETICLKCLEKEAGKRYSAAEEVAADLRRFLNKEPIQARPITRVERVWRWCSRNPVVSGLTFAFLVAIVVGLAGVSWQWLRVRRLASTLEQKNVALEQRNERIRGLLIHGAFATAMSGDFKGTEQAIKDAQLAGVQEHFIEMFRGQVALYGGIEDEAIRHLKLAVELKEDCVAARAMLSVAWLYAGDFDEHLEKLHELEGYEPKTPEDFLFLSQALMGDPARALEVNHEALLLRNSPLAHAVRAELLGHQALDTGDSRYARSALDEIETAKAFVEDNPYVLSINLFILHVALQTTGELGDSGGVAEEWRRQADQVALDLEKSNDYALGRIARAWYYDYVGNMQAAATNYQRAAEHSGAALFKAHFAGHLRRMGRADEAIKVLSTTDRDLGKVALAGLLSETPDKQRRAVEICKGITEQTTRVYGRHALALTILLRLGEDEYVRSRIDHWLSPSQSPAPFDRALFEFLGGEIGPEELQERVGSSRERMLIAHRVIGAKLLADGKPAEARLHFEACVATGFFAHATYHWAKVSLAEIETGQE